MADGLTTQSATPATIPASSKIATDDAGADGHVQIVKLAVSTDASATALTANNTDGLLVNLGSNNDVTVTGTVTANLAAGTNNIGDIDILSIAAGDNNIGNVDVVSSALPTGASTLAEQQSQTTHLATIAGDTTDIETAVELIDDTVATLGTTTYTEATTKGLIVGAVRRDADTTLADTTNEIAPLQVDANGRLKVEAFSGETLPVSLTSTTVTGTVAVTQSGTWDEVGINDSGNSITVDDGAGSLTVDNGGTFAVQESGAALTALQLIDDTVATDGSATPTKGILIAGQDGTNAQTIKTDTSGELQVDVLTLPSVTIGAAIPAGTNNIGDVDVLSIAAGDNNIGNVDVASLPGSLTGYAEDAAHNTGDIGIQSLAVRKDSGAAIAGTDGDYSPLQVDASGNLRVNVVAGGGTGGTSHVDDSAYTVAVSNMTPVGGTYKGTLDAVDDGDAGVFAMTAKRALHSFLVDVNGDPVSVGGGTQYTEDAAAAANPVGNAMILVREDARAGSLTTTDGDNVAARGNNKGELYVKATDSDASLTTIAGAVAGTEMQVDVVAALPAGTNAIGKLAANSGVDIGDVDVTSLPSTVHSADYDTGAGTDTTLAFGIAVPASGGAAVIPGDATAGLKVDLGADNDVTVTGTVTANLAAGTNAIGKLSANDGVDIGDVTVNNASGASAVNIQDGGNSITVDGTVSITANSAVNVAQVGGSNVVTAASGVQKVGIVGNANATVDSTVSAGTAPTNQIVTGQIYNTAAPTPTNGQAMAVQADQAGNTRIFSGISLTTLSGWTSATSVNSTQTIFTNSGANSVLVQTDTTSTISGGAITFECTFDGTNWVTIAANQVLDPTSTSLAQITLPYTLVASTNKPFLILTHGCQGLRIKLSTAITGTATLTPYYALLSNNAVSEVIAYSPTAGNFNVTLGAGTNGIGKLTANSGVDIGDVDITSIAAGDNNIGNVDIASIAAGDNNIGNIDIVTMPNVTIGTMANLTESLVDDAAFTPASSRVVPVGFEFDDSTPDSVNEGDIGAARMSANRNVYTTIRDAAGNERGANVDASSRLSVSVDNIAAAQTIATVTTVSTLTGGGIAHDSADSGNPVKVGARAAATLSDDTMVANADRTDNVSDLDGAIIVRNQFPLGDLITEAVSDTGGTSTAFSNFGATASTRSYITAITVFRTDAATTMSYIDFRDGTAGSVLYRVPLPPVGGAHINGGGLPLFYTTANTALAYDVSAALTTVYISITGFKSKARA